jgi:hypothetical protein
MKNLYILVLLLLILSCKTKPIKETSTNTKFKKEESLKKNEFYVVVTERKKKKNNDNQKELILLINDKKYFVKIDEGYVSRDKLYKYLNQTIRIKGEIKNGPWEADIPGSVLDQTQPIKGRSGDYIVVYKIIKN